MSHPLGPPEESRVLGQAMRTPEQLPALEETKAHGPVPRISTVMATSIGKASGLEGLSHPFYSPF